nr:HTH domain-containing protein [Nonlabens ulvanivorans]
MEEILELIKQDPKTTVKILENKVKLTRRGIEYHIANLKKQGKLKRIGSTKGGYWEVKE